MRHESVTRAQVAAVIDILTAIAETIRDLTELNGGVPSGELYAHLMGAGMNLEQYNLVIDTLKKAGAISVEAHYIKWIQKETR